VCSQFAIKSFAPESAVEEILTVMKHRGGEPLLRRTSRRRRGFLGGAAAAQMEFEHR
jgi:hypothetical protein